MTRMELRDLAARAAAASILALAAACGGDEPPPAPPASGAPAKASPAARPSGQADAVVAEAAKDGEGEDDGHDHGTGDEPGDPAPVDPDAPKNFEIVPPFFDFGVLEHGEIREVDFELFNRTEKPFQILSVTSGCKCLALRYDQAAIEPGKSAKLHAKVQATSAGMRSTRATILMTDPGRSKAVVEYRYSIVPQLVLNPKRIDFGRVETGTANEKSLDVVIHLPANLEDPVLEPFLAHQLPITVTVDPPTVTPPRRNMRDLKTTVRLKLSSNEPIPKFETLLTFQAKTPRTFKTVSIPVVGEVVPGWRFDPASVSFGVVRLGEAEKRIVKFNWPNDVVPDVQELKSDVPELSATIEADPKRRCHLVTIHCLATKPGRIEGTVSLKTSLGPDPTKVRVSARAKP